MSALVNQMQHYTGLLLDAEAPVMTLKDVEVFFMSFGSSVIHTMSC